MSRRPRRGPQGQILPEGISWDPGRSHYRLRWQKADGTWGTRRMGRNLEEARRELRKLERQAAAGVLEESPGPRRTITLSAYFDRWADDQRMLGRRDVDRRRNQLRIHLEPQIGHLRPEDLSPATLKVLLRRCHRDNGGPLSAKAVVNLKGILGSVYSLAISEGVAGHNPVRELPSGSLPRTGDSERKGYSAAEVERLLTHAEIPVERRILYSVAFFGFLRIGEACGLTFRDWDRSAQPLGALTVEKQYEGRPLKTARDDYLAKRRIPVHPELARRLTLWRLSGFREVYGRPPTEDDFLVPRRRADRQATSYNIARKALIEDERRAGVTHLEGRASHGFRKAAISIACNAEHGPPADPAIVRSLTHTAKPPEAFARHYLEWFWPTQCAAVQCIQLELPEPGRVISLEGRRGS